MKTLVHAILALGLVGGALGLYSSSAAAKTTKPRQVIMVWNGNHPSKDKDEFDVISSHEFIIKGTFHIAAIAWPINHSIPATGHFFVSNDITGDIGDDITVAQGAGDPPFPFHQDIGLDMKCKVGCELNFRAPSNIRWSVTVWH